MSYTPRSLFESEVSKNENEEYDIMNFFETGSVTYSRTYLILKAQRTVLENLHQTILRLLQKCSSEDYETIQNIKSLIDSILKSNFGTVFQVASHAVSEIRAALGDSTNPSIIKVLSSCLSCCLALTKIFTIVSCTIRAEEPPEEWKNDGADNPSNTQNSKDSNSDNDTVLVLCRICEEYIPIKLIENHSKICMLAAQSEFTIFSTDEKIRKLQSAIQKSYLNTEWPGPPDLAVPFRLPLLHSVMVLDRAVKAETDGSGNDILLSCLHSLHSIHFDSKYENVHPLMMKGIELTEEKLNACSSLSAASTQLGTPGKSLSQLNNASIADFDFLRPISSGAFARVFLARKKKTGDIYAIKVTPKSSLSQKNEIRRALAEKNILLHATNPFIVNFYYSFIGVHNLYLVMEFLPGGDLYSLLQHVGALDEESTRTYTCQIVMALQYLHQGGIVHRDIKPDNMLITADGRLKMTDFGLSVYGAVDRSVTPERVGTPDYVAPEIVLAQPHGAAVDFWSLGAVVFEMLTGIPPFHGQTEEETFGNIVRGHVDWGLLDEYQISAEAKSLLRGLLQADPAHRYGFAQIVAHPWFKGVDWEHLERMPPPFVPEVGERPGTDYFQPRSPLSTGGSSDIADDISDAIKKDRGRSSKSFAAGERIKYSHNEQSDEEEYMAQFPSVSLAQLARSTKEAARKAKTRHKRSSSADELEGNSLIATEDLDKINDDDGIKKPFSTFFRRDRAKSINKKPKI